jgi:hypothetical protein
MNTDLRSGPSIVSELDDLMPRERVARRLQHAADRFALVSGAVGCDGAVALTSTRFARIRTGDVAGAPRQTRAARGQRLADEATAHERREDVRALCGEVPSARHDGGRRPRSTNTGMSSTVRRRALIVAAHLL